MDYIDLATEHLQTLYAHDKYQLRYLFNEMMNLLEQEEYEEYDLILDMVDFAKLANLSVVLGFLGSSFLWRDKLKRWVAYRERVRAYLNQVDPSRVEALLRGF